MLPPPAITMPPRRILAAAQLAHDAADILARGEEEHLVAVLDDGVARRAARSFRRDRSRRRAPRQSGNVLAQRAQRLADQQALPAARARRPAAPGRRRNPAPAARRDSEMQARDVLGDQLLGADPHVHRERVLAEQLLARRCTRRTRTRAILFGVRYSVQAIWQASMLTSSLLVSATRMSVSAMPAASRIRGMARVAATVRISSRSCRSRRMSSFVSTTVTSLACSRER